MKVLIPMAGNSRRFNAGYKDPKQFIRINGKPMIHHVCNMFSEEDEFILICNQEQLENEKLLEYLNELPYKKTIIPIASHEFGPLFSCLQAQDVFQENEPVVISYCDFILDWNYKQFLQCAAESDGCISVFKGFQPASFGNTLYCYIQADEKNNLTQLKEKQCFTNNRHEEWASSGVYYIDRWDQFYKYANQVLEAENKVANEYYASLIYPAMLEDKKTITIHSANKFICWGTPEDLEEYLFWSKYFKNSHMKPVGAL